MDLQTPLTKEMVVTLKAGDFCTISGTIYTARDAAHKRLVEALAKNEPLPFDLTDNLIFYVGPTPAKPGDVIGSCGPTTSYRMDDYAPTLLDEGLRGMIGKGPRNETVIESMKKNTSVYFAAIGGCGALLAQHVKSAKVIAYDDLGAEAIHELVVKDFPVIVATDCLGHTLFKS